jgi:hypothetical protein
VRRNLIIATTSALVMLTACGGGGHGNESLGPPPEAVPTGSAPPPVATSSAVTGATGAAVTGSSGSLPTPTAGFALGGTSFVGSEPTSSTLRLTFFVHSASGTASFTPGGGACSVTVTTAEATAFDGTFSCLGGSDVNGTLVVSAQGTFSAAG